MRANNAKHISPGHLLSRRVKTNSSIRSVSILASKFEAIQGFVDSSWPAVTPKVLERDVASGVLVLHLRVSSLWCPPLLSASLLLHLLPFGVYPYSFKVYNCVHWVTTNNGTS